MAAPNTPGEARRQGLRRARWIAAGTALGAAVAVTGTIAVVNAAPSHANGGSSTQLRSDQGFDDEYGDAQPFSPQQQVTPQPQSPSQSQSQFTPQFQPQTRSRGS